MARGAKLAVSDRLADFNESSLADYIEAEWYASPRPSPVPRKRTCGYCGADVFVTTEGMSGGGGRVLRRGYGGDSRIFCSKSPNGKHLA